AYTRECLALEVDTSFANQQVTRVLEQVMEERGRSQSLHCDNGPELTSQHFLDWCVEREVRLVQTKPGRPMQNGPMESLQGEFRDESLNVSWFRNLFGARERLETWRQEYNHARPHSSLGYQTPEEFAGGAAAPPASPASPPTLAGILKTEGNGPESAANVVSASVRT
ncbi:MAG: integrase core domain-containing protein, partial [Acidobacteriia bacterium]|nr:integrase core domain-containing protein [Terriglobia bacterium]